MNKKFIVNQEERLDKFISLQLDESRNQVEHLIKKGLVSVDQTIIKKTSYRLKLNSVIDIVIPDIIPSTPQPLTFDVTILYEDDAILIIDKPAGVVVHDAPSVKEATLVDWLKANHISLSTISGEERHGIVHRLDKGTSGVMIVAKTNQAHIHLSRQLENRSMGRYYLALIDQPLKTHSLINKPLGRNPNNRLQMSVTPNGKDSKSAFIKLSVSKNQKSELIAAKLFTGRTHQIRAHLRSIHRHIIGDTLYGFKGPFNKISRFYLHAYHLYFIHPITQEKVDIKADIPNDMKEFLNNNFNVESVYASMDQSYIDNQFNSIC